MSTFYSELVISLPDERYYPLYARFEAADFSEAARTISVWSALVTALTPFTVMTESLASAKKRGIDPIPLLDTNLLRDVFKRMTEAQP